MKKAGRLIVFEGVDGVGKTTLAQALAEQLGQEAQAVFLSFPGQEPGTLGAEVYTLHHRLEASGATVRPVSVQLLHIAAHIDVIEQKILPLIRAGTDVVLDRFWWSTWVYGMVAGAPESSLKRMIDLERIAWGKVSPTLLLYVERSTGTASNDTVRQRLSAYRDLRESESGGYPIRELSNEGTIADALDSIHCMLDEPRQGPTGGSSSSAPRQLEFSEDQSVRSPDVANAPDVFVRRGRAKTTVVYDSYWKFATERQKIFFARLQGKSPPWTNDPVLQEYKFTNAYRASDRVSQYLIRHVIREGEQTVREIFFRTLLFKLFNRIETWTLLQRELGEPIRAESFDVRRYEQVLDAAMARDERVYSAAYIMPSGGRHAGEGRKHAMHLRLLERMLRDNLPERIAAAANMGEGFRLLRAYPTIGDFLAYQYITDLNYGPFTKWSEMQFVVPGPGALNGLRKCFSDLGGGTEADTIRAMADSQDDEFARLRLHFRDLWGRKLQLIDCQNLFCEVDKYARVKHPKITGGSDRMRIKQRFTTTGRPPEPMYPQWWDLDEAARRGLASG